MDSANIAGCSDRQVGLSSILMVAGRYVLFSVGWAIARLAENALVGDMASEDSRGRVFGYKEASASLGYATGPLVGGVIYETLGVHWTFLINGSMLLVTAALTSWWFADWNAHKTLIVK